LSNHTSGHDRACELAIVVPTLNEKENLAPLIALLDAALESIRWELIFVDDDSTDGTWQAAWQLAASRPNTRCIRRVGRRGLAGACVEGMLSSGAPYLAVMDADLQHDEKLLPEMLRRLRSEPIDIVVASRFKDGRKPAGLSSGRERMSRLGNWISRRICRAELTDPLSGFFMIRRDVLENSVYSLSTLGFKILVDFFASAPRPLSFVELPFDFRARRHGESKLDSAVIAEFALLLCDKSLGRFVPTRFVCFLLVGVFGTFLHLAVLGVLVMALHLAFIKAQAVATACAILGNYFLNNEFTYKDQRLRQGLFWKGLAVFFMVCATGAWVNLMLSRSLLESGFPWWLAGGAGAWVGGLWNYNITSFFVWRKRPTPQRMTPLSTPGATAAAAAGGSLKGEQWEHPPA
jgi:dolichol-phosphate mannosyltransferase